MRQGYAEEYNFNSGGYEYSPDLGDCPEIAIVSDEEAELYSQDTLLQEDIDTSQIVASDDRVSNEVSSTVLPSGQGELLDTSNCAPTQPELEAPDPAGDENSLAVNGMVSVVAELDTSEQTVPESDISQMADMRPEVLGEDAADLSSETRVLETPASAEQSSTNIPVAEVKDPHDSPRQSSSESVSENPEADNDLPVPGDGSNIDPPTDHGELRSGEPEEPLPLTVNDIRWESISGGTVSVVDNPNPGGEVLKLYQRPSASGIPGPLRLTTPGGTVTFLRGHEIIQSYKRDDDGVVESKPSAVFQGPFLLPDGFKMRFMLSEDLSPEDHRIINNLRKKFERENEGRTPIDPIVDFLSPLNQPHLEDVYDKSLTLMSKLTAPFRRHEDSGIRAVASDTPYVTLVHYPLYGKPMRVITPSGFLLVGYTGDAIELVVESRTGSLPAASFAMSQLAKDENFIVL